MFDKKVDLSVPDPYWETVHAYNRAVNSNKAAPLRCPECRMRYVTKIGTEVEPVLHCYGCHSNVSIGLRLLDQMKAVLAEIERETQ